MKSLMSGIALSLFALTIPFQLHSAETAVTQVFSINHLCVKYNPDDPISYLALVNATVTSSGWSELQLIPYVYARQPDDDVQDYELVASPPQGVALTVISSLSGDIPFTKVGWMKGIRVHGEQNALQVLFADSKGVCE